MLDFLEESKLCRKLRDFSLKYADSSIDTTRPEAEQLEKSAGCRFSALLNKTNNEKKTHKMAKTLPQPQPELQTKPVAVQVATAPFYQLREFLEAITAPSDDARVVVLGGKEKPRFRFLLLNPADRLREIVKEARAVILVGGTMRPVDQLLDAFQRVCGVSSENILQFSCGHVINDAQLVAVSIGA